MKNFSASATKEAPAKMLLQCITLNQSVWHKDISLGILLCFSLYFTVAKWICQVCTTERRDDIFLDAVH